jgi:hypothetical protein
MSVEGLATLTLACSALTFAMQNDAAMRGLVLFTQGGQAVTGTFGESAFSMCSSRP